MNFAYTGLSQECNPKYERLLKTV